MRTENLRCVDVVMAIGGFNTDLIYCLKSILEQRYLNNIYCVIDGCAESVLPTINSINKNNLVVIVNQKSLGLPKCLNLAISKCTAKYIARMDSDDLCASDRFEIQVNFMEKYPEIDVCGMYAIGVKPDGSKRLLKRPLEKGDLLKKIWKEPPFIHPTVLGKSKFFKENLYHPWYLRAQDWELFGRTIKRYNFCNIPKIGIRYSIGGGISVSGLKYKIIAGLLACHRNRKYHGIPYVFLVSLRMLISIIFRKNHE